MCYHRNLQYTLAFKEIEQNNSHLSFKIKINNTGDFNWNILKNKPRIGWQVYLTTQNTTSRPSAEGRIGEELSLSSGHSAEIPFSLNLESFHSDDYIIRVSLVIENICWLHELNNKACIYTFRVSHSPRIETIRSEDKVYSLPVHFIKNGYQIFLVGNSDFNGSLPLSIQYNQRLLFDWDIPKDSAYLFGWEAPKGTATLSFCLPSGVIDKEDYLEKIISLKHSFQFDIAKYIKKAPLRHTNMTFYYPWFRTPMFDSVTDLCFGDWERHSWQIDNSKFTLRRDIFPRPGFPIQSSHWPLWGPHSSNSEYILRQDLQFIAASGIGTVIVSWWPDGTVEDSNLRKLLDIAGDYGLKVCCLLEAFDAVKGKSADGYKEVSQILEYLSNTHFKHKSYLSFGTGPVLFEWGSCISKYKPKWKESNRAFLDFKQKKNNALTLVALYCPDNAHTISDSPADLFYTYEMYRIDDNEFSMPLDSKRLIVGIGPGYDERCIPASWRPEQRFTDRKMGNVFKSTFTKVNNINPKYIALVSYNELAEGTCIMPTLPRRDTLNNYEGHFSFLPGIASQFGYLTETRKSISLMCSKGNQSAEDLDFTNTEFVQQIMEAFDE